MAEIPELPEGPVTVMFTDIEASTALRTSVGDAAADDLFRRHDVLIRTQIEAHRGLDLQAALGDGFLAVFVSTRRAITCAVAVQQELDKFNRDRPGVPPLRVRIGLNTGEVAWQNGQPSGEAVHAASRVCAAASGGEVFVSDVTRQLAGTMPDVAFTDRGEFDLKGFPQPWKLWSLAWRSALPEMQAEVFVGRDHELNELRKHLRSALDGHGGLVLVGGEPGVGKTTLVKQLIKEAEQQGAVALFGRCYESEGTVPYSAFVETTEQALRLVPPEWIHEDLGASAAEVARMVPALRTHFPDIGEPLDLPPEQQRRYFHNAISDFLTRATERLPLVLIIDDVHWADEPTLHLVEHVAGLLKDIRLLAIGTYRDVELDVSRPLAATLERLMRSRLADRVAVRRFDRGGVAWMLEAHAGRTAPDALVDAVFNETEGNPFFVEEVFRHFVEEGKVFDENGEFRTEVELDELDVPESVRLVVGRRIERLGPDAQRVLAAGAVVGRGFEFELLERITDVDPSTLLDIVEEAERARVIIPEARGGQVFYTFGHELIRQTLLASLSLPRKQRLHLAVADAIEGLDHRAMNTRPSEISHHLLEAGAAADSERTVAALVQTAERALEAAAFEEARKAAEGALTYLADEDDSTRVQLLEQLGAAERGLGHFDRCIALYTEAADGYIRLGHPRLAAKLDFDVGYLQLWLNRFADSFLRYQHGLDALGDLVCPELAILRGARATVLAFGGMYDASHDDYAIALEMAEATGDDRALGRVMWGRCIAEWSFGRIPEAIEAGRRAVEHLTLAGDVWLLVDALAWLSFPLALSGETDEAIEIANEGLELATRIGHQAGVALARRGVFLSTYTSDGVLEAMLASGDDDLRAMEALDSPWKSQSYAWLSIGNTLAGRLDEALELADRAIETEPRSAWSGVGWAFRFLNRAISGDESECRRMLDDDPPLPVSGQPISTGSIFAIDAAVEGCALLGWVDDVERLEPLHRERIPLMDVRPFDAALVQRIAGMAADCLGRTDDAERHFEAALKRAEEFSRPDLPIAQHRYAELLVRRGGDADRERARVLLEQAVDGYVANGVLVYLPAAKDLLTTLG